MYNCRMKKHMIWLVELLVWGIIIFSVLFVSLFIYNKNVSEKYTYYVFFKDVDGLIKGSPVKIQGYQVGYVSNISIVNEDVFVTFIITDHDVEMPQQLAASVEFTGMGGSKSLELFVPPQDAKNKNLITTKEPRRINDFYVYQNQIAQNIVTMTSDFMRMFNDKTSGKVKNFISNPALIRDTNSALDSISKQELKILKIMEKKRNNDKQRDNSEPSAMRTQP